eukprot:NODE_10789_length_576_cov_108.454746_g10512_i0.p1 GENE.NODE_10789_length_576_cov_108.454746_g10512_i0~~NODE_10789_length_576_cov_108.454746_g10512_i0.p1  ORF type:complete len:137 (+),score=49.52 NODE_10789_length_576_cov_108.454746_g10512_i0:60-470(+)
MPVKNAVVQGYINVKQPKQQPLHFPGRTHFRLTTLGDFIKAPSRYNNFRFLACVASFWLSVHWANRKQRALKDDWEKNMRIQQKLHPAGKWTEETAAVASAALNKPIQHAHIQEYDKGFQMFDLKPKLEDPDAAAH